MLNDHTYPPPPITLTTEPRMIIMFWACNLIYFKHVSFGHPFLKPYQNTCHSIYRFTSMISDRIRHVQFTIYMWCNICIHQYNVIFYYVLSFICMILINHNTFKIFANFYHGPQHPIIMAFIKLFKVTMILRGILEDLQIAINMNHVNDVI